MTKMMETTLNACLEALGTGESIDSILSRYPEMMTELRPFLETAVSLKKQAINPTIAAKSASLAAMKKEAKALRPIKRSGFALLFHRARRFSPAMALFALLIVLFMATIAPPSSPLYGARLFLDGLRGNQQENDGIIEVDVQETAVSPTMSATVIVSVTAVTPYSTNTSTTTATPSPTITMSATPSPSATLSPSPTATMTQTATPSLTPSPTLIATPSPMPPATAVDDDSDDDDSDDSDDDEIDDDHDSDNADD